MGQLVVKMFQAYTPLCFVASVFFRIQLQQHTVIVFSLSRGVKNLLIIGEF
jgi:hypothetical protein